MDYGHGARLSDSDIMDIGDNMRHRGRGTNGLVKGVMATDGHLDRLMAQLEEDNRTLAELDRKLVKETGNSISSSLPSLSGPDQLPKDIIESNGNILVTDEARHLVGLTTGHSATNRPPLSKAPSLTSRDLDQLMAKLDQDNRVLAELDRKMREISHPQLSMSLPTLTSGRLYTHGQQFQVPTNTHQHTTTIQPIILTQNSNVHHQHTNATGHHHHLLHSHAHQGSSLLPTVPLSYGQTKQQIQQHQNLAYAVTQKLEQLRLAEDVVDSIEIPNRGRCKVHIAKYSYDPYKQSPNENPEAELSLAAGDFVLIFTDIDEDGFFYGETLDGRRGVVPSNFVEKLTGEDLFEFQATVLYGSAKAAGQHQDGDQESTASYPPEFYDAILNDAMGHTSFQHLLAPEDFHRMNDYVELAESQDIDEEDLSDIERAQAVAARDPGT
ncbi:Peripheral-type benzodiazepine receptor-associated protein 1 [Halotydeus destructor]|nr:Peripheral-type benzodiazepine receptor-associated protein 1 [Halotydeus destructor]